jgi:transcriptional regulator with GAF, ATPase, and Fis domain
MAHALLLHADIRVIAAANADFNQLVLSGKFRENLLYRLNVLSLKLPPLRERGDDIILLAQDFLKGHRPRIQSVRRTTQKWSFAIPQSNTNQQPKEIICEHQK